MDRFVYGESKAHVLKDAFADPAVFLCGRTAPRDQIVINNDAERCATCEKKAGTDA